MKQIQVKALSKELRRISSPAFWDRTRNLPFDRRALYQLRNSHFLFWKAFLEIYFVVYAVEMFLLRPLEQGLNRFFLIIHFVFFSLLAGFLGLQFQTFQTSTVFRIAPIETNSLHCVHNTYSTIRGIWRPPDETLPSREVILASAFKVTNLSSSLPSDITE